MTVTLQITLFGIHWTMALLAIPLAFVLAAIAARVVGETSVAPIGAIGKVSQLTFGALAPGQPITNLMTANVAGGAAGQSADLLNDFRAGHEIGASPARQVVAQCAGVLTGSLVGSLVYLKLIADPASELLTPEWPAPAVATWKAVAETLGHGLVGHSIFGADGDGHRGRRRSVARACRTARQRGGAAMAAERRHVRTCLRHSRRHLDDLVPRRVAGEHPQPHRARAGRRDICSASPPASLPGRASMASSWCGSRKDAIPPRPRARSPGRRDISRHRARPCSRGLPRSRPDDRRRR